MIKRNGELVGARDGKGKIRWTYDEPSNSEEKIKNQMIERNNKSFY